MTSKMTSVALAALLALAGCTKKSENPPPSVGAANGSAMAAGSDAPVSAAGSAGSAGSTAAGSGSAAPVTAAAEVDVPTEMDFEDDASAKITDKNVEAQVQAMEKQLEQK
jgi:hypothetical protein